MNTQRKHIASLDITSMATPASTDIKVGDFLMYGKKRNKFPNMRVNFCPKTDECFVMVLKPPPLPPPLDPSGSWVDNTLY